MPSVVWICGFFADIYRPGRGELPVQEDYIIVLFGIVALIFSSYFYHFRIVYFNVLYIYWILILK